MPRSYDLHSHSTASDGTLPPRALIERAHVAGVDVLALTDHDSTEGVSEAARAAAELGLTLIPGVEISVTWRSGVVHVLGLGVDQADLTLQAGLATLREQRDWRAEEMGRRLEKHGIDGAFEGAMALSNGRLISRTHFARFLVGRGEADSVGGVFKRFLKPGKPGYVNGEWAALGDAVSWNISAGGQAVIAHPARYKLTHSRLRELLGEFRDLGGAGLEVVSGSHSRDDALRMARYARDFGLRASSGSDYHGPEQPWIELGHLPALPDGCTPIWQDWPISAPA